MDGSTQPCGVGGASGEWSGHDQPNFGSNRRISVLRQDGRATVALRSKQRENRTNGERARGDRPYANGSIGIRRFAGSGRCSGASRLIWRRFTVPPNRCVAGTVPTVNRHCGRTTVCGCSDRRLRSSRKLPVGCFVAVRSWRMLRPGSWSRLAGESPVRVIAGELGSRPRFVIERSRAERGVESLLWREQERGPQHQANPAASSNPQRGSRAAHVTAKATSNDCGSGHRHVGSLRGTGSGTRSQFGPEQERPVFPASSAKTARISQW
jgi:hypothetical protein